MVMRLLSRYGEDWAKKLFAAIGSVTDNCLRNSSAVALLRCKKLFNSQNAASSRFMEL